MSDHYLTFEQESDGLYIHGNPEGIKYLIESLQRLVDSTPEGGHNHDHMWTPEWGGWELNSEPMGKGSLINKVTIFCWDEPFADY